MKRKYANLLPLTVDTRETISVVTAFSATLPLSLSPSQYLFKQTKYQ
jgi:hypothetical protein